MEMNLVKRINTVPLHIILPNLKHSYNSIKYSDLKFSYNVMYAGPEEEDNKEDYIYNDVDGVVPIPPKNDEPQEKNERDYQWEKDNW